MSPRFLNLPALACLAALVLFAVSANIVFASLLSVSRDFGVSPESLARVSAVQFTGFFIASLAGGLVADRVGKRAVLRCGGLAVMVGGGIWALAHCPSVAYVASLIMGLGGGVLEALSSALLTDLFPERRKWVLNISQVAYCIGAVGGPLVMGWLLPVGVSWRWFFAGTACGGAGLFFLFTVMRTPASGGHGAPVPRVAGPIGVPFRPGPLWIPCLAIFLYVTAEMGTATFAAVFLAEARGASERWAILSLAVFWAAMVVGRLLCAALPEAWPTERLVALLMAAAAVFSIAHTAVHSWVADLWLFGLTGLSFAGTWPLIVGLAATRYPNRTGTAVGLTAGVGSLGCIVAPPLLAPYVGGPYPSLAWLVNGALLAAGALVILLPQSPEQTVEDPAHGHA